MNKDYDVALKVIGGVIAIIIVMVVLIPVSKPDNANSEITELTGHGTVCLNGVTYYSADRRLAPAYNIDGSLIGCGE